jgi:integrase
MARSGTVARYDSGWGYRVEGAPDPATGRRRQHWKQGFRTKRAAEDALKAFIAETQHGPVVDRSKATLGEYLDEWVELQADRLRPSTLYSYRVLIARINAAARRVKLQALTPLEIEKLYKTLAESGGRDGRPLAPKTVKNTHVVLRKALADAERLGLVPRIAASAARAPALVRRDHHTWSSDELREFLNALKGERLRPAFVLLGTTGMRRGEVLGLRWKDVDFDAGELSVSNTLTTAGFEVVVAGPPKTSKSRRQIFLDRKTLEVLREHRRLQREERLAAGPALSADGDYVFTDELGLPLCTRIDSRRCSVAMCVTLEYLRSACMTCGTRTPRLR